MPNKLVASEERGVILVDEDTYQTSMDCALEWDVLTPITVKGKIEPVPIFQPRASEARAAKWGNASRIPQLSTVTRALPLNLLSKGQYHPRGDHSPFMPSL
ncbi:MAG: hypothetical protein SGPRY_003939 [Prymnesium sp.]